MIKGRSRSVLPVQFCLGEIMRLRNIWVSTLVLTLAASVIACGGDVKGVVTLDATAPTNQAIKMNADPVCLKEAKGPQAQETYTVGSDGKSLGNVFVYVKDGLGSYTFDPPTDKAKIDQKECRYHPHVFGMRVGQELEIVNSAPTLHNIHALPKDNKEFNTGQPIQGMKT